jgi:hypothetical protein
VAAFPIEHDLIVVDEHWGRRPVDTEVGDVVLLPADADFEGCCAQLRPIPRPHVVATAPGPPPPGGRHPGAHPPDPSPHVAAVEIEERGRYNGTGKYWPVRVRVKGGAKIKLTNPFQLGLVGDPRKTPPEAVEFAEEARFSRDDFGKWRVAYAYDPGGPRWRLADSGRSPGIP